MKNVRADAKVTGLKDAYQNTMYDLKINVQRRRVCETERVR